jgi:hypothetical protein
MLLTFSFLFIFVSLNACTQSQSSLQLFMWFLVQSLPFHDHLPLLYDMFRSHKSHRQVCMLLHISYFTVSRLTMCYAQNQLFLLYSYASVSHIEHCRGDIFVSVLKRIICFVMKPAGKSVCGMLWTPSPALWNWTAQACIMKGRRLDLLDLIPLVPDGI